MGWKGDGCWWCRLPAAELAVLDDSGPDLFDWHMRGDCDIDWEPHDCRSCGLPAVEMVALISRDRKRFHWHIVGACA